MTNWEIECSHMLLVSDSLRLLRDLSTLKVAQHILSLDMSAKRAILATSLLMLYDRRKMLTLCHGDAIVRRLGCTCVASGTEWLRTRHVCLTCKHALLDGRRGRDRNRLHTRVLVDGSNATY